MLLAKLVNPIEKVYQGQGVEIIKVTVEYFAINAHNYIMGSVKSKFYYKFGKVKLDEDGIVVDFNPVIRGYIELTAEELSDWGTDDFEALKAVAKKLNIEIEETPIIYENGIFKS